MNVEYMCFNFLSKGAFEISWLFRGALIEKSLRNTGLDRHTCGTYTRSTAVDGLSILCEAASLVRWRLSQVH